MSEIPMHTPEDQPKNGWVVETEEHTGKLTRFISEHFFFRGGDQLATKYDSLTELHSTGFSEETLGKVKECEIEPFEVKVLYEKGEPAKMHVRYLESGSDAFIMSGQALSDYLQENGADETETQE